VRALSQADSTADIERRKTSEKDQKPVELAKLRMAFGKLGIATLIQWSASRAPVL
jgi:hypothetical protein